MATLFHTPKLRFVDTTCVKANVEDHAFNVGEAFKKMTNLSSDVTIIGKDGGETKANRFLLGVFSQMLRPILFDQLNIVPSILLPDLSSNSIKHLINMITVGSSASHSIAFKELHEITEAAKTLEIDLTDIDWNIIKQKRKFSTMEEDCDSSKVSECDETSKDEVKKQDCAMDDIPSMETTKATVSEPITAMDVDVSIPSDDIIMPSDDVTMINEKLDACDKINGNKDQTIVSDQHFVDDHVESYERNIQTLVKNVENYQSFGKKDQALVDNYQTLIKNGQYLARNDPLVHNDQTIVKDEQTLVKDEQTLVKDDQTIVKDEQTLVKDDQTPVKDDQTLVKDDQTLVKDDQTLVNDDQTLVKDDQTFVKDDQTFGQNDQTLVHNDQTTDKSDQSLVKEYQNLVRNDQTTVKSEQTLVKEYQTLVKDDQIPIDQNFVKNDQILVEDDQTLNGQAHSKNDQSLVESEQTIVDSDKSAIVTDQPVVKEDKQEQTVVTDKQVVANVDQTADEQITKEDEETYVKKEQDVKNIAVENEENIVGDEETIVNQEKPIVEKEQTTKDLNYVKSEQNVIKDDKLMLTEDQPAVKNDQTFVKNEQNIVKDEQNVRSSKQNVAKKIKKNKKRRKVIVEEEETIVDVNNSRKDTDNSSHDQIMEVCDEKQNVAHERTKNDHDKEIFGEEAYSNLSESSSNMADLQNNDISEMEDLLENQVEIKNENYEVEIKSEMHEVEIKSEKNGILEQHPSTDHKPVETVYSDDTGPNFHTGINFEYIRFDKPSNMRSNEVETNISTNQETETIEEPMVEVHQDINQIDNSLDSLDEFDISSEALSETVPEISYPSSKAIPETVSESSYPPFEAITETVSESSYPSSEALTERVSESSYPSSESLAETVAENFLDNEDEDLMTTCQVCGKVEVNYPTLKTHYVSSHFSAKLKSEFGDLISKKTCVLCDKSFTTMIAALRHIGIWHEKLNEVLVLNGLFALPDVGKRGAVKRKSDKLDALNKKIKTDSPVNTESLLADSDDWNETKMKEVTEAKDKDLSDFKISQMKEDHMKAKEEVSTNIATVDNSVDTLDENKSGNETGLEEAMKMEDDIEKPNFPTVQENREIALNDTTEDEVDLSPFADDTICQICQKVENPGIFLWNHYLNSHYSKRIGQQFASFVNKKKCLLCNRKLSGSAAALKHVAVKHEKLNDLILMDGLAPLASIAPKVSQDNQIAPLASIAPKVSQDIQMPPLSNIAPKVTKDIKFENNDFRIIPTEANVKNILEKNFDSKDLSYTQEEAPHLIRNQNLNTQASKLSYEQSNNVDESVHSNQNLMVSQYSQDGAYSEENEMEEEEHDPLTCQICSVKKSSISMLQQHYINIHYTRKLRDRFAHLVAGNYCTECDIEFKSVLKGLVHLGVEHQKLNELLDEEGFLVIIPPKEDIPDMNHMSSLNSEYGIKDLNESTYKIEAAASSYKEKVTTKEIYMKEENKIQDKEVGALQPTAPEVSKPVINNPSAKFACDVCDEKYEKKSSFIRHTLSNRHYFTCDNCETNFRKKEKFEAHQKDCPEAKKPAESVQEMPATLNSNVDFNDKIISKEPVRKRQPTVRRNANIDANEKLQSIEPIAANFNSVNESYDKMLSKEIVPKIKADHIPPSIKMKADPITKPKTESRRAATEIACEICGEKFDNKKNFFRHCLMKNHYFTCDTCGKSFKKRVEFSSHQKSCTMN